MSESSSLRILTCVADKSYSGKPLKDLISKHFRISAKTLARLKRRQDGITVNGARVTVRYILNDGDRVTLTLGEEVSEKGQLTDQPAIVPKDIPVEIVYEDEDIVVANKPPYMPTHPSHGHYGDTLANALAYYYLTKEGRADFVFRSVNRLDRNTSGLVAVAKNKYSASVMCSHMSCRRISKTYFAVLDGIPREPSGIIDTYIKRERESIITRAVCSECDSGAMRAVTEYEVVGRGESHSLVKLIPKTGRTHQLRVHMAHIGCPITGDGIYGNEDANIGRHALHAASLKMPSTDGGMLELSASLPDDMRKLIEIYNIKDG